MSVLAQEEICQLSGFEFQSTEAKLMPPPPSFSWKWNPNKLYPTLSIPLDQYQKLRGRSASIVAQLLTEQPRQKGTLWLGMPAASAKRSPDPLSHSWNSPNLQHTNRESADWPMAPCMKLIEPLTSHLGSLPSSKWRLCFCFCVVVFKMATGGFPPQNQDTKSLW